MARAICVFLLAYALTGCGASAATPSPPTPAAPTAPLPNPADLLAGAATPTPTALPTRDVQPTPPAPSATPMPATALEQYRVWMAEARTQYPYQESIDSMWAVMICESEGNSELVADSYHGLFQYSPATWAGEWNPYRDSSIFDPHAQIFATAKAWHDGNQGWWGCYR